MIGIVQTEGKQRGVRRRAVRNSDVALVHHRVFQRRKAFCQNAHAIAWEDLNAVVRGTEQYRIAGVEGGKLAQGAQQFGSAALKIGRVPVVRFAAVDLGDDGQVIHVINGDKFAERTKPVPAFGLDGRAVEALFRQAHLVGQRVSRDVRRGILHAHLAGGFAHHQRHRRAAQHRFTLWEGDRLARADHRVMRFDKPHGCFRRRAVGGFFKRFTPGVTLALMVEGDGKNGTFHSHTPHPGGPGHDFINMLMIWFYAFAVYFAIRSEKFVI